MWQNVKAFFAEPYKGAAEMNVGDWFLFLGLILVLLGFWGMIFRHIAEGIEK